MQLLSFTSFVFASITIASAFPGYAQDLEARGGPKLLGAQPLPPPMKDTSSKLVHDRKHPYMPPGPNDQRGPCPGLNTMANHGVSDLNDLIVWGSYCIPICSTSLVMVSSLRLRSSMACKKPSIWATISPPLSLWGFVMPDIHLAFR
jgi:hypothetical protein